MQKVITVLTVMAMVTLSGAAFAADGAAIFKAKCAVCHGQGAQGTPGMAPQLAGSAFIKGAAEPIKQTIMNGREGAAKMYKNLPLAMPKLGINAGDADAIVQYLKSL